MMERELSTRSRWRVHEWALFAGVELVAACAPSADLGHWLSPDAASAGIEPDAASAGIELDAATSGAVDRGLDPMRGDELTARPPVPASAGSAEAVNMPVSACPPARSVADACVLQDGTRLPEDLTGDPGGSVRWFANGAPLPAGRYRIEYIDGCVRYLSSVFPDQSDLCGYTIHATTSDDAMGLGAFWLIAADLTLVTMPPGTSGVLIGSGSSDLYGAYATYEQCVEANCGMAAREFQFSGGVLALSNSAIPPPESVAEFLPGQRAPTFRLSYLDACAAASRM